MGYHRARNCHHHLNTYRKLLSLFYAIPLCSLLLIAAPVKIADAHEGASGIVKLRMDHFKEARAQMKQINGAFRSDDLAAVAELAVRMMPWSQTMADAFPQGSAQPPSEASQAIWQDAAGFDQAIASYQNAIISLQETALLNDKSAALEAFKTLGASCKSCHRSYRN